MKTNAQTNFSILNPSVLGVNVKHVKNIGYNTMKLLIFLITGKQKTFL